MISDIYELLHFGLNRLCPSLTVRHAATTVAHTVSSGPRRPVRLLEVEQAALASHVTSCRLLFVVPLFVLLAPWGAGRGDREDVALSYVCADSGCVAASWLCVL